MKINLLEISMKTARDLGKMGCDKYRNAPYVYQKITEELSEMNEELVQKVNGEECGKDGILGESVDFLISVMDMAYLIEEDETFETLRKKLDIEEDVTQAIWVKDEIRVKMQQDLKNIMANVPNVKINDLDLIAIEISNLLTMVGNLSVATQMIQGTTYKTPEKFGFKTANEFMISVLKGMTYHARKVFEIAYSEEKEVNPDMEDMEEKMISIWISKTEKWRKSRGI